MTTTVSILVEIPEELHESLQGHLESRLDWDHDRVISAALALFLLQHTNSNSPDRVTNYRRAARVYLDELFRNAI
ncbi:DUF2811 domain-containing protein [Oculatella sp. LEGE 06141]|uniref:DUF2811 domain-containing protein n=1 Tax=Oculatella sp. LEGE 06141 TaxID=1828648 RepID=UPI00187EF606|nr:DUF2811 domain-containing protein [Oculatella sp. LEGE 06141]MBE9182449.1 DUF2811 domain-containing protein [Oculatella sp. LEGE 06141]